MYSRLQQNIVKLSKTKPWGELGLSFSELLEQLTLSLKSYNDFVSGKDTCDPETLEAEKIIICDICKVISDNFPEKN